MQDDLGRATPVSGLPSRPASRNALDHNADNLSPAEAELAHLRRDLKSTDPVRSATNMQGASASQHGAPPTSYSYAAALGSSLSRSTTPDTQRIARAPSPGLAPIGIGRAANSEKRNINSPNAFSGVSTHVNDSADLVAALSGMNLSNGVVDEDLPSRVEHDLDDHKNYLFNLPGSQSNSKQHAYFKSDTLSSNSGVSDLNNHPLQSDHRKSAILRNNSYQKGSSTSMVNSGVGLLSQYQQLDSPNSSLSNYGLSGYSVNPLTGNLGNCNLPPLFENAAAASGMAVPGMDSRMLGASNINSPTAEQNARMGSQLAGSGLQASYVDPTYLQYLRTAEYVATQVALNDPSVVDRNYMGNSYVDLLQKAYLGSMLSQKSAFGVPAGSKNSASNHGYYGNPAFGVGLSYPGSPMSPVIPNSPVGPGSPMRHNDFGMRYSGMRNLAGGVMGPWLDSVDSSFASSLLEEFKSNKTKCFELSEIVGHVVEFRYM